MNFNLPSIVQQAITAVFAQPASGSSLTRGKDIAIDWIRAVGFVLVAVVFFLLIFYVNYPATLKRAVRIMPRTLYGRCLAVWLVGVEGLFFGLYWKHFVWGDQLLDINKYWPKVAWGVGMLLSFVGAVGFLRSPRVHQPDVIGKSTPDLKAEKT